MAKIGMGKAAADLQSGQAPTAAESTKATLRQAMGDMVDSMEVPEQEPSVSNLPTQPIYSEAAGFTPEGDLLPLDERGQLADEGRMNPEFSDWQDAGEQRYGADTSPVAPAAPVPARDDTVNMMARAEHFSKQLDKAQNPDAFTINWHPKSSVRDDYVNINKRIANSSSLAEKADLMKARETLLESQGKTENTLAQTINSKLNAVVEDPNTGMTSVDPDFGRVASMATENSLDNAFMGNKDVDEEMEETMTEDERGNAVPVDKVNPADLATSTGREVHKWWAAEKKARGEPISDTITDQEAKDLGAASLMTYAGSFPRLMNVDYTKGGKDADGNPNAEGMRFVLTDMGSRQLENNRGTRKRMFDTRHEPFSTPQPHGLTGDSKADKPAIRGRSNLESEDKAYASLDQIEESLTNQNGVAHMVDARRSRIALAFVLPSLYSQIGDPSNAFGDAFGLGTVSYDTIVKEQMTLEGQPEDKANSFAMNVMSSKKEATAREVQAIAKRLGTPSYLTWAMQPLTGRSMAQQTDFNPTRNKIVRTVTRSKHPAVIRGMTGRLYKNYMNILALSFGKDNLLSEGRIADIKENSAKYRAWGKTLKDNLDAAFPMEQFQQGAEAIATGQKVPDPSQQLLGFQMGLDPELKEFLLKKGEDAVMAVDALIDFSEFMDNTEAGRPHKTFVNAYIDGKTNGIANQAAMLGIRKLAYKTGLLREDGAEEAITEGDIRDYMEELITARLNNGTIPVISMESLPAGKDTILLDVLKSLGQKRDINKQISMIFPYGKELLGMKKEIAKLLPSIRAKDALLDGNINELVAAGVKLDDIVKAAHDSVVYSLFEIFGQDTFKTRAIMRQVGYMHAFTDDLFSIRGPVGHRINMGGRRLDPTTTETNYVDVKGTNQENHKNMRMKLNASDQYLSSASNKIKKDGTADIAGHVRGQSSVIPTQAFDAATVVRTSTGGSWQKLKDAHPEGDPYFLQIYDAYKVDVHNFDVISSEVNKNFLDLTTRDYNFLEEAGKELDNLARDFEAKMKSTNRELSLAEDGSMAFLGKLMDPDTRITAEGKEIHARLGAKAFVASVFPIDPDGNFMGRTDYKPPANRLTPAEIMTRYNKFLEDQAGYLQGRIVFALNQAGPKKKYRVGAVPDSINSTEALAVFNELMDFSKNRQRLSALVSRTRANSRALREEVLEQERRTGYGALQFHAH